MKTSESKRGLVMTSVSRSSTLSSMPGSATAFDEVEDLLLEQELLFVVEHGGDGSTGHVEAPVGRPGAWRVGRKRSAYGYRPRIVHGVGDPLDREQVRRGAHVALLALGDRRASRRRP